MKNLYLSLILLFAINFNACNLKTNDKEKCIEPSLKLIYTTKGCNGDKCGFFHTLMLSKYDEACFSDYDFIYIADKYLDSVSHKLPVNGISFVKPFGFQPFFDSRDDESIREHSIVDIYYTESSGKNEIPEISSISIWTNGVRKELRELYTSSRKKRMEYYNSKK